MWTMLGENPAVASIIGAAIPSILAAVLGYLRSVRLDKRAETAGAASFQFHGLIAHNEDLQKDNKVLRERITTLEKALAGARK